jgi:hypothetical protein
MNVKELLEAWEEGVVAATAPALRRREEVSGADLSEHMHVLRIRTHLRTGQPQWAVATPNASHPCCGVADYSVNLTACCRA